jgi:hypothetical protein
MIKRKKLTSINQIIESEVKKPVYDFWAEIWVRKYDEQVGSSLREPQKRHTKPKMWQMEKDFVVVCGENIRNWKTVKEIA